MRDALSRRARRKRIQVFFQQLKVHEGQKLIDLGGLPQAWVDCPIELDIHIVNLPGISQAQPVARKANISLHDGDATDLHAFADNSFDIAYCNSVIEHVGGHENQAKLANEVRRVADAYWVQTPSIWFPIEAHSMLPLWWFYPKALRQWLLARWARKLPEWTRMVAETTVISKSDLQSMLPDATIWTERKFGFHKSYVAFKPPSLEE